MNRENAKNANETNSAKVAVFAHAVEKEVFMSVRLTQGVIDVAADELLKEAGFEIEKVLANHVAVRLGKAKANGAIGDAVANWKERRVAEGVDYVSKAPAKLDDGLDKLFDGIRRATKGMVGKCLAESEESHKLEAQRWLGRYDDLDARFDELRKALENAEGKVDQLTVENAQLRSEREQALGEMEKARSGLNEARDMNKLLIEKLSFRDGVDLDVAPVPHDSDGVVGSDAAMTDASSQSGAAGQGKIDFDQRISALLGFAMRFLHRHSNVNWIKIPTMLPCEALVPILFQNRASSNLFRKSPVENKIASLEPSS